MQLSNAIDWDFWGGEMLKIHPISWAPFRSCMNSITERDFGFKTRLVARRGCHLRQAPCFGLWAEFRRLMAERLSPHDLPTPS